MNKKQFLAIRKLLRKISISDGDVLNISSDIGDRELHDFVDSCRKILGRKNALIVRGCLSLLPEHEMNEHGWFRAVKESKK